MYEDNVITSNSLETRTQAAYLVLKNLFENETVCNIVHKFDTRPSYVLAEYTPIILPSNAIGFKLRFEPIRYVYEKRVTLVQNMSKKKVLDASADKQKKGSKSELKAEEISPYILPNFLFNDLPAQFSDEEV